MNTKSRDAEYIASRLKYIRHIARLTQENVADTCGLTVRTIQKIESGKHTPDEQTVLSLARGLSVDASYFNKPSKAEEQKLQAELDRALRKIAVVHTNPIKTLKDFLTTRWSLHAYRIDYSDVEGDEVLRVAANMADYMQEVGEGWDDLNGSQRIECAESLVQYAKELALLGYVLYFGSHRQRIKYKEASPLTVNVAVLSFRKSDGKDETRYGIVNLEGRWEIPEEDRPNFPDEESDSKAERQ